MRRCILTGSRASRGPGTLCLSSFSPRAPERSVRNVDADPQRTAALCEPGLSPAAGSYRVSYVTRPSSSPPPPRGAQLLAPCHTAHKASYHFAEIAPDEELPFPFSRGELPAACWQTAAVDWHFLRAFLSFYLPYSVAFFFLFMIRVTHNSHLPLWSCSSDLEHVLSVVLVIFCPTFNYQHFSRTLS